MPSDQDASFSGRVGPNMAETNRMGTTWTLVEVTFHDMGGHGAL